MGRQSPWTLLWHPERRLLRVHQRVRQRLISGDVRGLPGRGAVRVHEEGLQRRVGRGAPRGRHRAVRHLEHQGGGPRGGRQHAVRRAGTVALHRDDLHGAGARAGRPRRAPGGGRRHREERLQVGRVRRGDAVEHQRVRQRGDVRGGGGQPGQDVPPRPRHLGRARHGLLRLANAGGHLLHPRHGRVGGRRVCGRRGGGGGALAPELARARGGGVVAGADVHAAVHGLPHAGGHGAHRRPPPHLRQAASQVRHPVGVDRDHGSDHPGAVGAPLLGPRGGGHALLQPLQHPQVRRARQVPGDAPGDGAPIQGAAEHAGHGAVLLAAVPAVRGLHLPLLLVQHHRGGGGHYAGVAHLLAQGRQ
mmetsp:Transcript_34001/g.74404  ORF Transcript_34001/g.74404 Transcript_34001/m.74404 type:complete len:361 (+) Transcript_34001:690-1772(+)